MKCEDARRHWSLYYDSETGPEKCFQISEHLSGCAECRQWFEQQSRFERGVERKLQSISPSPEVWERVANSVRGRRTTSRRQPWAVIGTIVALAASLLAATVLWTTSPDRVDLTEVTAAQHTQLVSQAKRIDYESESDIEVEGYLRRRVNFPVRCPPRQDSGFFVRGAGLCRLADWEAAYLVGHVDQADVSIFILPDAALTGFSRHREHLADGMRQLYHKGHYTMAVAAVDQSVVLVVGRVEEEQLFTVLDAYGSYHHQVRLESRDPARFTGFPVSAPRKHISIPAEINTGRSRGNGGSAITWSKLLAPRRLFRVARRSDLHSGPSPRSIPETTTCQCSPSPRSFSG